MKKTRFPGVPDTFTVTVEARNQLRRYYRHARRGGCSRWHASTVVTAMLSAGWFACLEDRSRRIQSGAS